jgi:hypothetical protein
LRNHARSTQLDRVTALPRFEGSLQGHHVLPAGELIGDAGLLE